MGRSHPPKPVKLFVAVLASSAELLAQARDVLAAIYGDIDSSSVPHLWNVSDYYEEEMGTDLLRQYVSFDRLIDPDRLAAIKLQTNDLEDRWRRADRRAVNLDPGYIGVGNLVLATTKDAGHRIYVADGIFAEATLIFERGSFRPHAYTYRDYADATALEYFQSVRVRYLEQLRARKLT